MKLDYRIKIIMAEIKQEMQDEYNYPISEHEIAEIFQSQFKAASYAISKGFDFKLFKFATFRRKYKNEIGIDRADITKLKPLLPTKEYRDIMNEFVRQSKLWLKKTKKKKQMTLQELLDAEVLNVPLSNFGNQKEIRFESIIDSNEEEEYEYL